MAARGRKPKLTIVKEVMGNPGGRPLNKSEPKIEPGIPEPPEFLGKIALEEWHRRANKLFKMGVLTELDSATLAAYCTAYETFHKAQAELNHADLIVKTSNGTKIQNPLVGIRNKAANDMKTYAAEFGMTPVARTKITATEQKDKDEAEKFFG